MPGAPSPLWLRILNTVTIRKMRRCQNSSAIRLPKKGNNISIVVGQHDEPAAAAPLGMARPEGWDGHMQAGGTLQHSSYVTPMTDSSKHTALLTLASYRPIRGMYLGSQAHFNASIGVRWAAAKLACAGTTTFLSPISAAYKADALHASSSVHAHRQHTVRPHVSA